MNEEEKQERLKRAYAAERGCENFKIIVASFREMLAELDANNRVPGKENRVSGAMVLADILAMVDGPKDTETAA